MPSKSVLTTLATALVLLAATAATGALAAEKCSTSDCSDIAPKPLVKDNLGNAKHFSAFEKAMQRDKERTRRHRNRIQKREKSVSVGEKDIVGNGEDNADAPDGQQKKRAARSRREEFRERMLASRNRNKLKKGGSNLVDPRTHRDGDAASESEAES